MKIIDLYNMVANGEQPTRFNYKNHEWLYSVSDYDFRTMEQEYITADVPEYRYLLQEIDVSNLNDEIEIIEEEKEIEKIEIHQGYTEKGKLHDYLYYQGNKYAVSIPQKVLTDTLNKLIDEIEKLKKVD